MPYHPVYESFSNAVCLGASGDIDRCLEFARETPSLCRNKANSSGSSGGGGGGGNQLERFLLKRASKMLSESDGVVTGDYCRLLGYELLYLWNALGACLKNAQADIRIGEHAHKKKHTGTPCSENGASWLRTRPAYNVRHCSLPPLSCLRTILSLYPFECPAKSGRGEDGDRRLPAAAFYGLGCAFDKKGRSISNAPNTHVWRPYLISS